MSKNTKVETNPLIWRKFRSKVKILSTDIMSSVGNWLLLEEVHQENRRGKFSLSPMTFGGPVVAQK